jgi:hypothetical protein
MLKGILEVTLLAASKWIVGLIYGKYNVDEHKGMQFLWSMLLLFWVAAVICAIVSNDDLIARIVGIVYSIALPGIIFVFYKKSKKV